MFYRNIDRTVQRYMNKTVYCGAVCNGGKRWVYINKGMVKQITMHVNNGIVGFRYKSSKPILMKRKHETLSGKSNCNII